MKKLFQAAICLGLVLMVVAPSFAQENNQAVWGLTNWGINGQRVASQFNYQVYGQPGYSVFTFPPSQCSFNLPGNKGYIPWNTNATVTVNDQIAANTETVSLTAFQVNSNGLCTLTLSTSNTHTGTSYWLSSGTCGLREALNDLGTTGGVVIVDQEFYFQGCTQSTITGITTATNGHANQFIVDISNGQNTWYELKPLNNTALSVAGVALTATLASGGSLTSNGTYLLNYEYVDCLGGQGLPNTESSTITLTGVQTITTSAVAAATGACGYIPMITASGGSTTTEIAVPVTSSVCTLSTTTPYPTCAIGSTAFISANPSGTAKENVENFGHTSTGYLPINGIPSLAASNATWGDFQTNFLPFVVGSTINNSADDLAQVYVPAQYFNHLGATYDVCLKGNVGTAVASSVLQLTLTLTNNYQQNPVVVSTVIFPTLTLGAAGTFQGCFEITTAVTGTGGRFWATSPGAWGFVLNSTGTGVSTVDNTAAISTSTNAPDLTKNIYLTVTATETASHNITAPIINQLTIRPVPNN